MKRVRHTLLLLLAVVASAPTYVAAVTSTFVSIDGTGNCQFNAIGDSGPNVILFEATNDNTIRIRDFAGVVTAGSGCVQSGSQTALCSLSSCVRAPWNFWAEGRDGPDNIRADPETGLGTAVFFGGNGNDVLDGGVWTDLLFGGPGNDVFRDSGGCVSGGGSQFLFGDLHGVFFGDGGFDRVELDSINGTPCKYSVQLGPQP